MTIEVVSSVTQHRHLYVKTQRGLPALSLRPGDFSPRRTTRSLSSWPMGEYGVVFVVVVMFC